MEEELDPDIIKATQGSLGKYIKRPPLTDKLLKKPPFRFLHDIVTSIIKNTGFFDGLFEEGELKSENVKDRESKIVFLNKVISVVASTTGKSLLVKPSKIVSGQEPDKTNELLQCIALALDKKLSSDDAVRQYKETLKQENKSKETKVVKKNQQAKKLTSSQSTEKLIKNDKNDSLLSNKTKQKDQTKKESPPKRTSTQSSNINPMKSSSKTGPNKNKQEINKQSKISVSKNNISNVVNSSGKQNSFHTDDNSKAPELTQNDKNNEVSNVDDSIISKTETESDNNESKISIHNEDTNVTEDSKDTNQDEKEENVTEKKIIQDTVKISNKDDIKTVNADTAINDHEINKKSDDSDNKNATINVQKTNDNLNSEQIKPDVNVKRPPSVRPSSSRPSAPRLKDKHENVINSNENIIVGKVTIIPESTPEEDDDNSIVIVDNTQGTTDYQNQGGELHQRGHLVQQILDAQKEFSQTSGKTEIEWQFGVQKSRDIVNEEIEQLRFNIQALSRVANPLGKLLDHIQEDVEVMRQELHQWTNTYEDASKELLKQRAANEESLFPLHNKIKQLDLDIAEKQEKINDLKIIIHKNAFRIEKLLANGQRQFL
ncbi:TRAF3-interacting protein 1 [Danaus plexippus plexippus]|uniref:TRAF3-interacting protein 1 n=1 Tax=Danaus plexippus plexippus TaxID=278856 RepID=A0A212ETQ8_DANPL|nr:TRAF3-interacting protein 1 [Danaus plexippus plexippus]